MVPLLQIFQGSNKLHWQAFEWLWNIPHGQQSSIISITAPWLRVVISAGVGLFLCVNGARPHMDVTISLLLFISKKCCVTNYSASSIAASLGASRLWVVLLLCGLSLQTVFSWRWSSFEAVCVVQNEALHSVRCHTPTVLTNMLCVPWCAYNI